jgi:hypothetical protein
LNLQLKRIFQFTLAEFGRTNYIRGKAIDNTEILEVDPEYRPEFIEMLYYENEKQYDLKFIYYSHYAFKHLGGHFRRGQLTFFQYFMYHIDLEIRSKFQDHFIQEMKKRQEEKKCNAITVET